MNPYISDILSQPDALREAVRQYSPDSLAPVVTRLQNGEFDRIVITGMGASYNAAYPAYLELTHLAIPVMLVNAAELVHYMDGSIGIRTLLWANSQSGRSAELLHLLQRIGPKPPACILASVNDETSPLASAADVCLPIHAGLEMMVSTKTYLNMLAVNLLAAHQIARKDIEALKSKLLAAADAVEAYLKDWQLHVEKLDTLLGEFETLMVIGRGPSMSSVWNGSLINKEAAKFSLEGMNAADFRHGPLELASPGFTALIFGGLDSTVSFNRNLAMDITWHEGQAIWVSSNPDPELPTFIMPNVPSPLEPLAEILPMQVLTLVLAKRNNVVVGQFRIINKVTTVE